MFDWLRMPRLSRPSRRLLNYAFVWVPIVFLFFWKLESLTPGLSTNEIVTRQASGSLSNIFHNPTNAPFKLLEYGILHISHSPWALRGMASAISVIFIFCFWRVAVDWFGRFVGALSTLLFASTTWLSVDGRLADGNNWLLAPIGILALFLWLRRTEHKFVANILFWLSLGLAAYVPGLLWLELVGIFIARKRLIVIIRELRTLKTLPGPLVYIATIVPLAWSLVGNWRNIKPLLLIPNHFNNWLTSLKDVGHAGLALVWQSPVHLPYLVGRWPMLSIMQVILAVFGITVMWERARRIAFGILVVLLLAVVGAGLNQAWWLLFLGLPSLTVLEAAGLRHLYLEWRTIFPRNPLAQSLATIVLLALIGSQLALAGYYSLSTWPNLDTTRSSYVIK